MSDPITTNTDDLGALVAGPVPFYRSRKFWGAILSSAIIAAGTIAGGPAGASAALLIAGPILGYVGILGYIDAKAVGK